MDPGTGCDDSYLAHCNALTHRDLAILTMVHDYRGCTTDQIHKRFWPNSRSPSAAYRRIALLVSGGHLQCQRLPSLTGVGSGKRFLTLGSRGRLALATHFDLAASPAPPDIVTALFADHRLAIGDFRLTLELAVGDARDVQLLNWTCESELRKHPIRVENRSDAKPSTITLVPDGAFTIQFAGRRQQCFLEMDMGTIAPKRLEVRVRGYLLQHASVPTFFVTPDDSRSHRIAQLAELEGKCLGRSPSIFFITTRQRVTRDTILVFPIWEQVGVPERQVIVRPGVRSLEEAMS